MSARVLVCGGRDYADRATVDKILTQALIGEGMTVLAHGGATGADSLAGEWAAKHQIDYRVYPARWNEHGKSAGPRRNVWMLNDFKPDLVIAFPGGRGTAHMVSVAKAAAVEVLEVAAEVGAACPGFHWIGQTFACCDNCGAPYWEHEFDMQYDETKPMTVPAPLKQVPITPEAAEACRRKWAAS